MKEIELNRGIVALIDDQDFDAVSRFKWHASHDVHTNYARSSTPKVAGQRAVIWMHRIIINPPYGFLVDHIDRNGLNNQRSNLRICTPSQNNVNRKKKQNATSIYKGVAYVKADNRWRVTLEKDLKYIHGGIYLTEIEAAIAYNKKAVELHGDFTLLNIIP